MKIKHNWFFSREMGRFAIMNCQRHFAKTKRNQRKQNLFHEFCTIWQRKQLISKTCGKPGTHDRSHISYVYILHVFSFPQLRMNYMTLLGSRIRNNNSKTSFICRFCFANSLRESAKPLERQPVFLNNRFSMEEQFLSNDAYALPVIQTRINHFQEYESSANEIGTCQKKRNT